MTDDGHLRTFIALEIAEEMRERIAAVANRLRESASGVRWARPEGVHLTLRFLGSTSPAQVERLAPALAAAAAECEAGEVGVSGLGTFPERGAPRVLWLGLSLPDPILKLQAACEQIAAASGFPREERPFRPHLTLGRWRDRARRPELPAADLGSTPVDTLVLFRSETRPGGSVYTPLHRWRLREPRR